MCYLMTAEGGTSFEHSEMAMRIYAPHGLLRAFEAYEREVSELGECIPQVRDGERCYLGTAIRAFHADRRIRFSPTDIWVCRNRCNAWDMRTCCFIRNWDGGWCVSA